MMAQLETTSSRHDRCTQEKKPGELLNLVAIASETHQSGKADGKRQPASALSFKVRAFGSEPRRVKYQRIAAHSVGGAAAWLIKRNGGVSVRERLAGAMVVAPRGIADLPETSSAILRLLRHDAVGMDHQSIASAIIAVRSADAVIVGPLSPDDSQAPGLLPHLAELASGAYRALRPPAELIAHPGFGQLARRFHFIQMSHHDVRWLAAGAIDVGVLAQSLCRLQGGQGEFAITSFHGSGVLWAESRWWEIEPIDGEIDESRAGAAFCSAWVVARRFLRATAAQALVYARSAAMNSNLRK